MRLAQIVDQKGGKLPIPEAFGRMLGLYERSSQSSSLFRVHLRNSGQPVITTIPPRSWLTVLRISVLLEHRVGQVSAVATILADLGINILLMEGYGYHPDEEGWWSAVIDFPSLHKRLPYAKEAQSEVVRETKVQLVEKVEELLGRLIKLNEGSKPRDFPIDEPADIGGFGLVAEDGRFVVKIEPMKLRRLVTEVVEDLESVRPYRVHRNAIHLPSDAGPRSRRIRKLMLCNTEERFIRLIDTEDLAEIDLEVHTEAQDTAKEGVGVLALVTQILKDFESRDEYGRPISNDRGVNVAFTYNYIMADGVSTEMRHRSSETSVIKMFLESPPLISDLGSKEQCRIWRDLFTKLLNAKRSAEEQPFVEIKGSRMTIWQRRKRIFRSDKNRRVREVGLAARLVSVFVSPERAVEAKTLALSIVVVLVCSWLARFSDLFNVVAHAFAGAAVLSLLRLLSPKFRH